MGEGTERIYEDAERRAVRKQAVWIGLKSAVVTAAVALLLSFI